MSAAVKFTAMKLTVSISYTERKVLWTLIYRHSFVFVFLRQKLLENPVSDLHREGLSIFSLLSKFSVVWSYGEVQIFNYIKK